jgi:hypothetical protein
MLIHVHRKKSLTQSTGYESLWIDHTDIAVIEPLGEWWVTQYPQLANGSMITHKSTIYEDDILSNKFTVVIESPESIANLVNLAFGNEVN